MNGRDFREMRRALGLSQGDLGRMLGLSQANPDRGIRKMEDTHPSGPAAVAISYMAQGALDETMQQLIPEYVLAHAMPEDSGYRELVIRLWYPRFIALVATPSDLEALDADVPVIELAGGAEGLALVMQIDPARPDDDMDRLLHEAASHFEIYTQDSFEASGGEQ